jgi:hypothetical protein
MSKRVLFGLLTLFSKQCAESLSCRKRPADRVALIGPLDALSGVIPQAGLNALAQYLDLLPIGVLDLCYE